MENLIEINKDEETHETDQKNEIKNDLDLNSQNQNKLNNNIQINSISLIESIFILDKEQITQLSYPKINKENFPKILEAFNKGIIPKFENKGELLEFIIDKIKVMEYIKNIIQNKYEILQIIISFFDKNNFSLLEFFIDLYFKSLEALHSENPFEDILKKNLLNNNIINKIIEIINWIILCGFTKKKNYDYILRKLALLQLSKKLNNFTFCEYLHLLEIFYGKNYDSKYEKQLVAQNYIYFYDKENSGIYTNIDDDKNFIEIKEGITIFLWFYLIDESGETDNENILVEIGINDDILFKIILDNKNDIIIKNQEGLLEKKDEKVFDIPKFKWIQLKIELQEEQFKLNLFKGDINELNKEETNIKYETKIYSIDKISFENSRIKSLNFFKNFLGLVGTIIFCNSCKNSEDNIIKSECGLEDNQINSFLKESLIEDNYFIFSPLFYVNEKNMFIDSTNGITGKIINNKNNNVEFNGVFNYKNSIGNIYYLGGSENILPLFEIFYKFTNQKNSNEEEDSFYYILFKKLIKILESIIINKNNYIEILKNNTSSQNNSFLQTLQLFLEMIDEKYFQEDDDIVNSLLNIGKQIITNPFQKIEKSQNYFSHILFSQNIIIKFNLAQQHKLWEFFEEILEQESEIDISYLKKCFLSFEQMSKFFVLLSDKYPKETKKNLLLTKSLKNIIKTFFCDKETKDNERENFLILLNYDKLNENIIIEIIDIYNYYLEEKEINVTEQNEPNIINPNIKEQNERNKINSKIKDKNEKNKINSKDKNEQNKINSNIKEQNENKNENNDYVNQKDELVNKILNSKYNYIEMFLKLFLTKNREIKKEIIIIF